MTVKDDYVKFVETITWFCVEKETREGRFKG